MAATSRVALALAVVVTIAACRHTRPPDANLLTSRCTNKLTTRGKAARIPTAPSLRPGFGGIVGTLADSGGALPQYPVRAEMLGTATAHATAIPDSLGGFVFEALQPGRYRLFVKAYSHKPDSTEVEVASGQVDTVRVVLQFFTCVR